MAILGTVGQISAKSVQNGELTSVIASSKPYQSRVDLSENHKIIYCATGVQGRHRHGYLQGIRTPGSTRIFFFRGKYIFYFWGEISGIQRGFEAEPSQMSHNETEVNDQRVLRTLRQAGGKLGIMPGTVLESAEGVDKDDGDGGCRRERVAVWTRSSAESKWEAGSGSASADAVEDLVDKDSIAHAPARIASHRQRRAREVSNTSDVPRPFDDVHALVLLDLGKDANEDVGRTGMRLEEGLVDGATNGDARLLERR
ncbi:hypothetical protein DFH07DRAFT_764399 [Mycena maculata]|uniref:Uncharacterized protein n=1 Tax=Mycena maculata TaxID=230809 RepID=A0AAD7KBG9_9AGAR|nr:hypothetical protein DFH07DRAFT_764399 [Mycena maculata]